MKFYFTTLARRPLTLSGSVFTFELCSVSGGRANGIFATEDPTAISILDDAVRGRRGVQEITEADYVEQKKKQNEIPSSRNSNVSPPRVVRPKIELAVAAPSAGVVDPSSRGPIGSHPEESAFRPEANVPSIGNLLKTRRVNPPKPFAASDQKIKAAVKRGAAKAARAVRPAIN
jgi:hypothetical protein